MSESHPEDLKGHVVAFRIRDIHLPEPTIVLDELHGGEILEGEVIDCSGGKDGAGFVLVRVAAYRQPVIVSVNHLLRPQ